MHPDTLTRTHYTLPAPTEGTASIKLIGMAKKATTTEPEMLEPREESTAWSRLETLLLLLRRLISLSDDLALSLVHDVLPVGVISLCTLVVAGFFVGIKLLLLSELPLLPVCLPELMDFCVLSIACFHSTFLPLETTALFSHSWHTFCCMV